MTFDLHPKLAADSLPLAELGLSSARLLNDSRYVWVVLIPRRRGLTELHELLGPDRIELFHEIDLVSTALQREFEPDKLNVGALGNIVSQLHIHVVARRVGDVAWPGPVWGVGVAQPYGDAAVQTIREKLALSA